MPLIAWADLYDDYMNSTSKQSFISFQGRKASIDSVGHAFVGVGIQLDASLRYYERLFGLYPSGGVLVALKSAIRRTSGRLDLTWKDLAWDTEIIKQVDEETHNRVLATFDKWTDSAPQYSLLGNGALNCNGLLAEVAKDVGLIVPGGAGTTRPWKFIEAIKKEN
jgi:hypothetical protein